MTTQPPDRLVRPVSPLHDGQHKDAAPADDLGLRQPEAGHDDGLRRRGFLVAEKAECDEQRRDDRGNDDLDDHSVPPSERGCLRRLVPLRMPPL